MTEVPFFQPDNFYKKKSLFCVQTCSLFILGHYERTQWGGW